MPGTVLVVEDEPEIAALLRDFLDDAGFGVSLARAARLSPLGAAAAGIPRRRRRAADQ